VTDEKPDWDRISKETVDSYKGTQTKRRLDVAEALLRRVREGKEVAKDELDAFLGVP
jgi:hypothetical protein